MGRRRPDGASEAPSGAMNILSWNCRDSVGLSGGLALYWHESLSLDAKAMNSRYIDAYVTAAEGEPPWRLTCVYGEPRTEDRHLMWSLLRDLHQQADMPWMVIGQMIDFRDVLEVCGLDDPGFAGLPYTYDNWRSGRANVKVRLDRAVANNAWAKVEHLVAPSSDHLAILLKCVQEEPPPAMGRRCRQYEVMWERDPSLLVVIMDTWTELGSLLHLGEVADGLKSMMKRLQDWSRKKFGNVIKEINKSRSRLEEHMSMNADRKEIREANDRLNELLYHEEMLWMQRSFIDWLREGDRNTKFFHRKAVWRARKNRIKVLMDDDGVAHKDHDSMAAMATSYFTSLFTADTSLCADPVIDLINSRVTNDMNVQLCAEYTDKEIADALF
ncbi:uncharacterized protein [Aegilops tauschii subsp. strangulata]|uniref:uncharacterized protein n=1 Tax=Aegilops tauschii subsp. strangulata TaxID=200361 RepID=UPI003CC8AD52